MHKSLVRGGIALAFLASTLAVSAPANAAGSLDFAEPPGEKVTINLVAMAGSGCTPGTADVAVSPDNTAFTALYSDYTAAAGPNVSYTENRKNCQLNVKVTVPNGFTYAIAKVDYRGYGNILKYASATHRANYYFQGMSSSVYTTHTLPSPLDDFWQITDEVALASYVWHPCNAQRNLNINTELRVNKGSSKDVSHVSMDSVDGSIETIYHLAWRRC